MGAIELGHGPLRRQVYPDTWWRAVASQVEGGDAGGFTSSRVVIGQNENRSARARPHGVTLLGLHGGPPLWAETVRSRYAAVLADLGYFGPPIPLGPDR